MICKVYNSVGPDEGLNNQNVQLGIHSLAFGGRTPYGA